MAEASNCAIALAPSQSPGSEVRSAQESQTTNTHATLTTANVMAMSLFEVPGNVIVLRCLKISVDGDFAWSEWSAPDVTCAEGTQTRTTLCGAWRRRLPPKAGRNPDDPAGH